MFKSFQFKITPINSPLSRNYYSKGGKLEKALVVLVETWFIRKDGGVVNGKLLKEA